MTDNNWNLTNAIL